MTNVILVNGVKRSFYGRQEKIELIKKLTKNKTASLVILRGRRRIGKSSLAEYVAQDYHHHLISM